MTVVAVGPQGVRVPSTRRVARASDEVARRNRPNGLSFRRVRLALAIVALLAVLGAWAALTGGGQATADGPGRPLAVTVHTVMGGESLWSISASVTPAGSDVRDVLLDIAKLNNLVESHIEPGMTLVLPARA
ncbi:LysM peptidoglycan-binding domain-containing protein [Rarobacter faecitabidus]|uniref:LysM domain-containing protein n=1 Tax=Rarobacter faecitabidus TaxID=13243 RepID=A0A542ZWA4_RARFA|nr:LysM peptidoglycan-binding domain-containing protein [Rarobacter faecitabidus]TQL64635.1 LysM domain-containing protein [Rarobacter faecitabidus]